MKRLITASFLALLFSTYVPQDASAQTRIRFARGRTSTSVSGTLRSLGERDFVLSAYAGQYLSANVSSSGGCVKFSTISTSQAYTTEKGDNWLKLMNMCRRSASFIMTVSIR